MHFSIPDTQELSDGNGSSYTGYNIHINGVYHCTLRYKQLLNLHEQLRHKCGNNLPLFPPKKLLPLTSVQLSERRAQLEKYIQAVGQEPRLSSTSIFNGFLLTAQQETRCEKSAETTMDVFLMNGFQIQLNSMTTDCSVQVLDKVCQHIHLPQEYVNYFALFIIKKHENGDVTFVRKLEDFESPYMSMALLDKSCHKIVLRKMYWDNEYDFELMRNSVSLNLLYVQTVSDIEKGWILCNKDTLAQLATFQARGAKREYLEVARTLKYYGFMQFGKAICDYPLPDTSAWIAIGNRELNIRVVSQETGTTRESCFKVVRMRCWRITTTRSNQTAGTSNETSDSHLELSFEYLISKDKLRWINISSDKAILMSVCLQSVVEELLLKKNGSKVKRTNPDGSWLYMRRDGSRAMIKSNSNSGLQFLSPNSKTKSANWPEHFSMKKLQEKLSSASNRCGNDTIGNDAFEEIGDEDL